MATKMSETIDIFEKNFAKRMNPVVKIDAVAPTLDAMDVRENGNNGTATNGHNNDDSSSNLGPPLLDSPLKRQTRSGSDQVLISSDLAAAVELLDKIDEDDISVSDVTTEHGSTSTVQKPDDEQSMLNMSEQTENETIGQEWNEEDIERPLQKIQVVIAGQIGTGKTRLRESLFPGVGPADDSRCYSVYSDNVAIPSASSADSTDVSLEVLELPGTLDVNENDVKQIKEAFLVDDDEAASVYPNVVLLVVKPKMSKQFQAYVNQLIDCGLIDEELVNLVVVVTHAHNVSKEEEIYVKESKRITREIKSVIKKEFKISDIKVAFVDYDDTTDGDDVILTDGIEAFKNLIDIIDKQFEKNNDKLGLHLKSYLKSNVSPSRKSNISMNTTVVNRKRKHEEVHDGNSDDDEEESDDNAFLGVGYCPKTERCLRRIVCHGRRILVDKDTTSSRCITRMDKLDYERSRLSTYGLSPSVPLVVDVGPAGRWLSRSDSEIRFLYEHRLQTVRLNTSRKHLSKQLLADIEALPAEYTPKTKASFDAFFERWGTHFVDEVSFGGTLEIMTTTSSPVDQSEFDKFATYMQTNLSQPEPAQIGIRLKTLLGMEDSGKTDDVIPSQETTKSDDEPMETDNSEAVKTPLETIVFVGGTPPSSVKTLEDLTTKAWSTWTKSIERRPIEIESSIKLSAYYHVIDESPIRNALHQATLDFLGRLPPPPPSAPFRFRPSLKIPDFNFCSSIWKTNLNPLPWFKRLFQRSKPSATSTPTETPSETEPQEPEAPSSVENGNDADASNV